MSGSTTVFSRGENPLRADKLNLAFSERVLRAGDVMDGFLTLAGDPVDPFDAATKQYVDRLCAVGLPPGGPFLPLIGGTVSGDVTITGSVASGNISTFLTLSGGVSTFSLNTALGKSLRLTLGGNTTNFTINPGSGTTGNPFAILVGTGPGLHAIDMTQSLVRTKTNWIAGNVNGGAYSLTTSPLAIQIGATGALTLSSDPEAVGSSRSYLTWAVASDTASAGPGGLLSSARFIDIQHNWGGAGMSGGRLALNVHMNQAAASGTPQDCFYGAGNFSTHASFNQTGGDTTIYYGRNFPLTIAAGLQSGATNWYANIGCEWDTVVNAGASVAKNGSMTFVQLIGHTNQGVFVDASLNWVAGGGVSGPGWRDIMLVGNELDFGWPCDEVNGAILRVGIPNNPTTQPPIAKSGVDFSAAQFVGNAYSSRHFAVAGDGTTQHFNARIAKITGGVSLDIPLKIGSFVSIANGGTDNDNSVQHWYRDNAEVPGLWLVSVVSGAGAVTAVSIIQPPYSTTSPATLTLTNTSAWVGGSCTVNVSWTANNALSIQPSGGATVFGGPISYTATGGTVSRPAQDRAADVANVLDYGADPTGVLDSAPAIKAAAAKVGANGRNKAVYLPTGTYRVNSQITLTQGQCLYGDSRGSTIIRIDQAFSPTDTAVLYLTSTAVDPGPMVRDLAIQFIQPTTVTSRASFLTLAGGGTSDAGGTGVMYPPAIAGGTTSVRSQVSHVRISGAWDGITTNGLNHVFWLDDIEMGALNCGVSLGEGASGVLDFAHINGYHFWNFDFSGGLITVFNDGQTIGMRLGNQNGLDARGVCLWVGRLVFTSQASAGWFDFTNLLMDGTQATVEIAAGAWIQISNFYSTAGSTALRSQFSVAGGTVIVNNWYSTCSSPFPDIAVSGGYVTIIGGALQWSGGTDVSAVTVSAGVLRMNNMRVVQNATTLNTVPLIAQTGTGGLQVDNMDLIGAVGSGGISISIAADSQYNIIGSVSLPLAGGWSISVPNTRNDTVPYGNAGLYGAVFPAPLDASSIQTGAYSFRAFAATKHYSTAYGHLALSQAQDGAVNNTAFGSLAGQAITTGINNTLLGRTAGFVATTGSNNILVGYNPDNQVLTTGSNNLLIGNVLGIASASTSNTINVANILKTTGIDVPATAVTTISGSLLASVSGSVTAQAPLLATTAPLHVQATGAVNSLEGKVWLHGSFPTGADFSSYVAAAIRSGWSATAWTGGYADIWVTNAPNNPANDANMGRVARFTSSAIIFDQPLTITASGPTIRAGTGAATGTQPKGSLWMRTDGAVGSTLYVSQGAGTWNAVAAV